MNDQLASKRLHHAIDTCLSGICADPFLAQRVMMRKESIVVRKKVSFSVIVLAILLTITVTAMAMGIYEAIKPAMDIGASALLETDWELRNKVQLIQVFREFGLIDANNQNLIVSLDETQAERDRNHAADLVIDQVCGNMIRESRDPSILQQEDYPSPSLEDVFTVLYRSQNPDADDNIIAMEFDRWFSESELFIPADEVAEATVQPITSEEDIKLMANSILSEVYNFNKDECAATQIDVLYNQKNDIWIVTFYVKAVDLRSALKAEWIAYDYDSDEDAYTWSRILSADGHLTDATSVVEYEWMHIIPREAYPHWDVWEDDYRAFLYCTTEERAAFSAQYKPIVDSFLDQHPAIREYYETHDGGTAYQITRHIYGIPNAGAISEDDALQIAFAAWQASGVDGVKPGILDDKRSYYCLYDVSDPDKPVWKVSMQYVYDHIPDQSMNFDGFFVVIDAHTGEILKQYIQSGPDGMTQYCDSAYKYAEMFL